MHGYLTPLADAARDGRVQTIASLNYDNVVELAFAQAGVSVTTGIEEWHKDFAAFERPAEGILLLKLHGSINWVIEESYPKHPKYGYPLMHPVRTLKTDGQPDVLARTWPPLVVFGTREKLRADGPFLELMHAFRRELFASERVVVIGYSFRDEHINESLLRWIERSKERRLTILDPGFPVSSVEFMKEKLKRLYPDRLRVLALPAREGLAAALSE